MELKGGEVVNCGSEKRRRDKKRKKIKWQESKGTQRHFRGRGLTVEHPAGAVWRTTNCYLEQ